MILSAPIARARRSPIPSTAYEYRFNRHASYFGTRAKRDPTRLKARPHLALVVPRHLSYFRTLRHHFLRFFSTSRVCWCEMSTRHILRSISMRCSHKSCTDMSDLGQYASVSLQALAQDKSFAKGSGQLYVCYRAKGSVLLFQVRREA